MLFFLCLIFVLSGAAGLVYESIWTRYLGLFVGHGAYAQVLVLVIFLGGMSLGALAVGRRAERVASPLRWYAGVELAVGIVGLLFHDAFVAATRIAYDSLFPALGPGALHVLAKWGIAALLILPQSVLLGATFPLMVAGALRHRPDRPGRTIALLYFANSLGAAAGVLVADSTSSRGSAFPARCSPPRWPTSRWRARCSSWRASHRPVRGRSSWTHPPTSSCTTPRAGYRHDSCGSCSP